jgi:beta-lactamase regulating signal transducer with metallopeptidase domain
MQSFLNTVAGFLVEQSWQISIVVGLVLVACWILRNASAHWRYWLWLVVIAKCLMPSMVTLPLPVLPPEKSVIPLTTFADARRPIGDGHFDASMEIAKSSTPIAEPAKFAATEHVASSVAREPIPLPHASFNLREWLVTAWLLIVGILIIQVTGRMWSTHRRLKRTCQPADEETQSAVVALAQILGMKNTPAVHMADSFAQPFVWGWLRGDVYLPKLFTETGTVEQRRAILMHELAHVLRWDAAVNHLQNIVQAVFFFHPLIWWTNQKIRQEREKCCDEIVLSVSDTEPRVYCEAIVEILAKEYTSRQSTPALVVTGSIKNVKERITTMLTPNRKFRRRPSRAAVLTMLLVAACVLPTALVIRHKSATQRRKMSPRNLTRWQIPKTSNPRTSAHGPLARRWVFV